MTERAEEKRVLFAGGAKRCDRKPPFSLVPIELMEAVAETRREGDVKYGAGNWMLGSKEFFTDCLSHGIQHLIDAPWDETESLETHFGHAATNIAFMLWALKRGKITKADLQNIAIPDSVQLQLPV